MSILGLAKWATDIGSQRNFLWPVRTDRIARPKRAKSNDLLN
jgi:hypothetical protein